MVYKEYIFNNKEQFKKDILAIDNYVPFRSKGRKTEHTEKYSIVSFLTEFHKEEYFNFPFTLTHRDKPDFSILSQMGQVGIEFTESIPEQLARAQVLLEKNFQGYKKLEPYFFGWDAPERNDSEILEILKKTQIRLFGQGSNGKSVEEKWIIGIQGCIANKTSKLNNVDFEKYGQNWLLIYDNQSRPVLDKDYVSKKLIIFLQLYLNENNKILFDKIFIESGNYFYVIDKEINSLINVVTKETG